jgi:hypothetical protein
VGARGGIRTVGEIEEVMERGERYEESRKSAVES